MNLVSCFGFANFSITRSSHTRVDFLLIFSNSAISNRHPSCSASVLNIDPCDGLLLNRSYHSSIYSLFPDFNKNSFGVVFPSPFGVVFGVATGRIILDSVILGSVIFAFSDIPVESFLDSITGFTFTILAESDLPDGDGSAIGSDCFFTGTRTLGTVSGAIERPLVVSRGEIVTPRFRLLVAYGVLLEL